MIVFLSLLFLSALLLQRGILLILPLKPLRGCGGSSIFMWVICLLATSEENSDSDSFLPGDEAVHEAHDVLSKLDHQEVQRWLDGLSIVELANFHDVYALRFVMASNMLNRESRFLSSEVLKLHETVLMLKGEQSVSSATIAQLEARLLSVKGGSFVIDSIVVHDLMSENEKLKKDIASLQELSQLVQYSKDILEFDIKAL
ncbi:hypothetical protein Tco_0545386 [Tanacetum coccineum]